MSVFSNAKWIFAGDAAPIVDRYYDYRQSFSVSGSSTLLYISAHTNYAVYVNGVFVDCGQLPDMPGRLVYDTLDISRFVHPGENLLEVTQHVTGEPFMTTTVQEPGVIFAIWDGETVAAVSSEQTLSGRNLRYLSNGEKLTIQLGFNFNYDANGEDTVFTPSVIADKPYALIPRPIKKLKIGQCQAGKLLSQGVFLENDPSLSKSQRMQTAYLSSVPKKKMITETDDGFAWKVPEDRRADGGYFLFDLEGETIGYPQLVLEADGPTEILVGFGEHLEDLRVRSSCGYRHFCFRYVAKPGENLFFHPFRRLGLKFMQLHIYGSSGKIRQVGILPTRYPMEPKPMPVTDGLHKRIWQVASKTLNLCMQDYFCDCVWREQAMYAYDGRMEMLASYYGFHAPEFNRESLRICAQNLRPEGFLEICAPGTEGSLVPSYSAVYLRGVWEYTQYSGDESLAWEIFPVLKTIAEHFTSRIQENHLIPMYPGAGYWHFYEWQPGMDGKLWGTTTREVITTEDYDMPMNAFVADGLDCFGALRARLGMPDADTYRERSRRMKQAMHKAFYREAFGGYASRIGDAEPRHEVSQGFMLYLDAVPEECRKGVEALIKEKKLLETTLGLSVYTYEGLLRDPENREFVLRDVERRWGWMLQKGADTFWETERGPADFGGAGDLCQGWSAIPLYLFGHYKLGQYSPPRI